MPAAPRTLRPSPQEELEIVDMGTLLSWAGLHDDDRTEAVQAVPTGEGILAVEGVPAFAGTRASLLTLIGCAPNSHFRMFGSCTVEDFNECMPSWRPKGQPPTMTQRGAAKCAHRTARCLLKLDPWPDAPAVTAIVPAAPQVPILHGVPGSAHGLIDLATINVAEIIDQQNHTTITYVEEQVWLDARAQYRRIYDRDPPEQKDFTREQLAAVRHVLNGHKGPYVDMSIFGAFGARRIKRHAMTGLLFNQGGLLHKVEMYGPPSIDDWLQAWGVLSSILVALKAASRPNLGVYRDYMIYQAKHNGHSVWPLLYQADVRCRSERMPVIRDQLVTEHNARITASLPSTFDTSCPWDRVFKEAIESPESERWWAKEFEKPALRIITRMGTIGEMLDGDAKVEEMNARTLAGSVRNAPTLDEAYRGAPARTNAEKKRGNNKNKGNKTPQTSGQSSKGKMELCKRFNSGKCEACGPDRVCPKEPSRLHKCSKCNDNHPETECGKGAGKKRKK